MELIYKFMEQAPIALCEWWHKTQSPTLIDGKRTNEYPRK